MDLYIKIIEESLEIMRNTSSNETIIEQCNIILRNTREIREHYKN
jgi:hypothetical protein